MPETGQSKDTNDKPTSEPELRVGNVAELYAQPERVRGILENEIGEFAEDPKFCINPPGRKR